MPWYFLIALIVVIVRFALTSGARAYKNNANRPAQAPRARYAAIEPDDGQSGMLYPHVETPAVLQETAAEVLMEISQPLAVEMSETDAEVPDLRSMVIAQAILQRDSRGGRRMVR